MLGVKLSPITGPEGNVEFCWEREKWGKREAEAGGETGARVIGIEALGG